MTAQHGAPLTQEELGRIATEHAADQDDPIHCAKCCTCWHQSMVVETETCFPCDAAKLYALVLRQGALMAAWGLPCSCDPDFDLEPAP